MDTFNGSDLALPEAHVEFPLTREQYNLMRVRKPDMWRKCLFSPSRGTGYLLDPDNDANDRALMAHWEEGK